MNTPSSNKKASNSSFCQQIWFRIRRVGVEFYAFVTTPFVFKNCLGMVSIMFFFLMMTFWWLKCYTNHGESVQVPSYEGMSFREAAKKARSRDFSVAVSDSIYIPGEPPGQIVSQDPKPNSRVKEGRTIYFTVTKNNPDILKLPDLKAGDDYEIYSRRLSRIGLKPRIVARAADPGVAPNTIIAVIYKGDTITEQLRTGQVPVEMGASIDFVVSEEVTLTVTMPDCLCHTLG
ncbi:MAG: PASTA domain-containing protein, partial [Saprospiraceae bacterium]|nr:PASTA domain-containing protein [Saprospiraceae bacterium]